MDSYAKCPELGRTRIDSSSPPSDATVIGTGFHAAAAATLEGSDDPMDALRVAIGEECAHPFLRWNTYTKVTELEAVAESCFHAWEAGVLPTLSEPVSIEHKFNLEVGTRVIAGTPVNLRIAGTWDFEDVHGVIWDWKTASSLRAYGPQAMKKAVQPTMYTLAKVLEDGLPHSSVLPFRYGVVVKKKTPEISLPPEIIRQQGDWAWLIHQMWTAVQLYVTLPEGPWPLIEEGWICSAKWCENYDNCRGKPRLLEIGNAN